MMEWIVTSSAMILIVIALRGLLKGKIGLKLQYGLWALVLIRLLIPFSIMESAISISNVLSAPVIQEADDAVADYESAYQNAVQRYETSGADYSDLDVRQQVQQELYDRTYTKLEQEYAQAGATVPQVQIQTEAQQQVEVISLTAVISEALPYLWIIGMMVVAVALIGSNIHFGWKLRQSRKPLDIPGVPLKVYLTDYVATPCLFGFGRPDVYLTNEVMTDSKMRGHVLAHEMSHYRQGDHIWSVLRCVCLVLHWYNPLVWTAAILSKQDAELACDEATIKKLGEAERVAYGRTLIGMTCVRRDPSSLMLTATTMLGTKKTLKDRIALIAKKPKTALYTLIACVLVASLAVGCTFTGASGKPADEKDEIWEQVQSAVDACNNSQSLHMSSYTCSGDIHQIDFEAAPKQIECWIYTDTYYSELNGEDGLTPNHLMHNGVFYNHLSDNEWLMFGNYEGEFYSYIDLPRDKNLVTDWTETDERLEVIMKSGDITTIAWMDNNGKLLLYAVTDENLEQHFIYLYHDTPEQEIRQKVESVVSNMEVIERDDVLTDQETLLLNRCRDAVAYIQNLEHFEITERRTTNSNEITLGWDEGYYLHTGDDWFHSRKSVDWENQSMQASGRQYAKDITIAVPEEDIPYPEWTETDLSQDLHAHHCWFMEFEWEPDHITFRDTKASPPYDIISVDYESSDQEIDSCVLSFWFDSRTDELVSVRRTITEQYDIEPITTTSELWISAADPYEIATIIARYRMEAEIARMDGLTDLVRFTELLSYNGGYWYWRAMGCIFEKPEDIDLSLLCYLGMKDGQHSSTFTDDEIAFLQTQDIGLSGDDSAWSNAHKLPRKELSTVMQDYFGITLDDVTIPDSWVYYSETDAYYHIKYDAYGLVGYTITDVVLNDDGLVYVYWTVPFGLWDTRNGDELVFLENPQMVMVMEEREDGGYLIYLNMPVDELLQPMEPTKAPTTESTEPITDRDMFDILFSAKKLEANVRIGSEYSETYGLRADMEQPLRDLLSRYD